MKILPSPIRGFANFIHQIKKSKEKEKRYSKFVDKCKEMGLNPSDVMSLMMEEFLKQETKTPTKEEYLNQIAEEKVTKEKIRELKMRDAKISAYDRVEDLKALMDIYITMDRVMTEHAVKILDQRIISGMNQILTLQNTIMNQYRRLGAGIPAPESAGGEEDEIKDLAKQILKEFGAGILTGKLKGDGQKRESQPPLPPPAPPAQSQSQVSGVNPEPKTLSLLPAIERVKNTVAGGNLKDELKME